MATLLITILAGQGAYGQTANPSLPGSADPARVEERVTPRPAPLSNDNARPAPDVNMPGPVPAPGPDSFMVSGIVTDGITALNAKDLNDIFKDYTARPADLRVLEHMAARITAVYRARGYFLSKAIIPPQEIENGVVRVRGIEGYVDNVHVNGKLSRLYRASDHFGILDDTIAAITAMRPLNGDTLLKHLLLLNDLPGIKVESTLVPAQGKAAETGAVALVLTIEPLPRLRWNAGFDNYGSRYTGPVQGQLGGSFTHIFLPYDTVSWRTLIARHASELRYVSGSYRLPLRASGTVLDVSVNYSDSRPGSDLSISEVQSHAQGGRVTLTQPFIRSRGENLSASATLDIKDIETDILGQDLYDDNISAVRLGMQYDRIDSFKGLNFVQLTLSIGTPLFGARETGNDNVSRSEGRGDFMKFEFFASRFQAISEEWSALITAAGQFANGPLFSSEEFGIGGQSFGRAYDPSEMTGDHGIAASIELRYTPPPIGSLKYQPYAFIDAGKIWNEDISDIGGPESLSSAGVGVRLQAMDNLSASLAVAFPLWRRIENPVRGDGTDPRYLFSLGYSY